MENETLETSYRLPLFKSLTEVILLAGCPVALIILNGTMAVISGLILHSWYVLPFCLVFYFISRYLGSKDAQCVECFSRYIHKNKYYST